MGDRHRTGAEAQSTPPPDAKGSGWVDEPPNYKIRLVVATLPSSRLSQKPYAKAGVAMMKCCLCIICASPGRRLECQWWGHSREERHGFEFLLVRADDDRCRRRRNLLQECRRLEFPAVRKLRNRLRRLQRRRARGRRADAAARGGQGDGHAALLARLYPCQ